MDAAPCRSIHFVFLSLLLLAVVGCSQPAASPLPSATGTAPAAASPSASPSAGAVDASPSPSPSEAAQAFPVTLTDYTGTDVELAARPETIVSLTPAATETLFAIGGGDRVAGKVEDIASYPPQAADVPVVGTFSGVDVERIVALNPDLVIAGGNGGTPDDVIERLRTLGLTVLVVYADDIEGVLADIEQIGAAAGEADAARDLTASMRAGFDRIERATADVPRPRVFYETGDQPAIYGVADESFVAAMIELAGGDPITTGSTTVWEMSQEKLVEADPELILLGDAAYGVTAEAVAARPGWAQLTAVKTGEIHPIDDIVVTRPGPRLLEGLHSLVEAIQPEVDIAPPSGAPSPSPASSGEPRVDEYGTWAPAAPGG